MRKKERHAIYHLGKMHHAMILFKAASINKFKDPHQFSCKIQVLYLSQHPQRH
jgi:hypothetical protein